MPPFVHPEWTSEHLRKRPLWESAYDKPLFGSVWPTETDFSGVWLVPADEVRSVVVFGVDFLGFDNEGDESVFVMPAAPERPKKPRPWSAGTGPDGSGARP